jgi:pyruvate formate lyase activating enzyme
MAEGLNTRTVLSEIWRRRLFLDGAVISGGEPTLYPSLQELLEWFRETAEIPVKLDTNGSRPEVLGPLVRRGLVDAVAMDVKAPWEKYSILTGVPVETDRIRASIELLRSLGIAVEFRTTFVPGLLTIEDLQRIRLQLDDDPRWVVQLFRPEHTLDPALRDTLPPAKEEIACALPGVRVRG